jgi:hypothetical protein
MTRGRARLIGSVMAAAVLWAAPAGAQVTAGQVDDFEDGTTEGWIVGGAPGVVHPTPPANVASGGPAGAADNYLRLTAIGGGGPGSRLSAYNGSQWTGDYLAAGITGISMDLRNFGPDEVTLRLLLLGGPFGPMGPAHIAVTTTGVTLSPGGTWTSAFFPLTMPGALNVLVGTAAGALSNAVELRLFHNPIPVFGGPGGNSSPAVTTTVGVDNVRAIGVAVVPEPSTVMLLGTGALLLAGVARARRRG